MIGIKVIGIKNALSSFRRISGKVESRRAAYNQIAVYLRKAQTEKLTQSRGRRGLLPKVQKWTRIIAGKNPSSRVLLRTGQLRRSFNALEVSDNRLVFGPRGGQERDKAISMVTGREGLIKVSPRFVRTNKKTGGQYVRIRSNDGRWYTKPVSAGTVPVTPQEREFIFLDRNDKRQIGRLLRRHVARAIQ